MKKLLFDSDVLIDILRNNQKTIQQVDLLIKDYSEFCCSSITIAEIFAGMYPKEEGATRNLLKGLTKLLVSEDIAELAGRIKYKTKTHNLYLDDCLIAATAMINECILVTKNIKHYPFSALRLQKIT